MAGVTLQGFAELKQKLAALPEDLQTKVSRAAVRKAMEPVLADAQRFVPKRTGALYESLALTTRKESDTRFAAGLKIKPVKKKQMAGKVGTSNTVEVPRRYFHLVEFGSSRAPAHPFIRPAFDGNVSNMLDRLKAILGDAIVRASK